VVIALDLRIVPLADRPELIDVVAHWHWDEWGHEDPRGSSARWAEGLRRRAGRDAIPITWVALVDDEPVGSVALIENDMATHPELSPWLSGLFVVPDRRAEGIGSSLTGHCEAAAATLGVRLLYLYTTTSEDLYRRRGWEAVGREVYGAEEVVVMAKHLAGRR
jgi:predicted N-acetyltransferase YhbS